MYIPPHTGLPANCTDLPPLVIPAGHVAVFDEKISTWQLREDHRGKTVYDGDTGRAMYISDIGTLPVGAVSTAPTGPHDKWNGTAWGKDYAAEKAALIQQARTEKAHRMSEAGKHIAPLEDAVELKMATQEEKAQLTTWKTYRVLLSRVDPDKAPGITWPVRPAQ